MAYQTYITEALVCGAYNRNTSDRSFLLFSREAGMIYGVAKSVREERSKQRFALQDFSYVRVSLIRGKTGWRIVSAEPIANFYADTTSREARATLRNTIRLIRRTMHGEVPHPIVFDDLITSLQEGSAQSDRTLELLLSLRILSELGYVAPEPAYERILAAPSAAAAVQEATAKEIQHAQKAVEKALMESQL